MWEDTVTAFQDGGVGASILVDTGILNCDSLPVSPQWNTYEAFAQAKDLLSGRLSNTADVVTGCLLA